MTVYAVHEVQQDVSAAVKFGKIWYINRFYIHGDELEQDPRMDSDWVIPSQYRLNMMRAAEEFHPSHDFVLIAGDHLQLLAFFGLLLSRYNSAMVLRYDRKLQDYIPVRLYSYLDTVLPVR